MPLALVELLPLPLAPLLIVSLLLERLPSAGAVVQLAADESGDDRDDDEDDEGLELDADGLLLPTPAPPSVMAASAEEADSGEEDDEAAPRPAASGEPRAGGDDDEDEDVGDDAVGC